MGHEVFFLRETTPAIVQRELAGKQLCHGQLVTETFPVLIINESVFPSVFASFFESLPVSSSLKTG